MPQHSQLAKLDAGFARRPDEARAANSRPRELIVSGWDETSFAKQLKIARIATEPLAVRVIPAALTRITQRKLLLHLPATLKQSGAEKQRSFR